MKNKITLKDIAKELGFSKSTVSKALNDSHEISLETRKKIKAFADFYNYKPNSLALKLRNQKTYTLGVVIPQIVHHFFSNVLSGIDEYANALGYNVMVCLSNDSHKKEVSSIETLFAGNVDGILISVTQETQQKNKYNHIEKLIQEKFPIVLFDNIIENLECDKVTINDEGGAFKSTEYLIESGCKKIALLAIPEFVRIGSLRKTGYLKALKKHNIEIDDRLIVEIDDNKDVHAQLGVLFDNPENYPDAILAVNGEVYASTAMQIAKDKGLKIPQDISIVTFTDGLLSRHASPPMTSLVQHGYEMGKQAVELLIDRIENNKPEVKFERKVISTNLKIRNSTQRISQKIDYN